MTALGIALSGNGQHREAIHMLLNVAKQRTDVSSVHADLGMALFAAGQVDRGIEAFHTALQIDPRSAQAYCGLGLAHQKLEHWEEAAAAFRATEQLAPEKAVGPFNLGIVMGVMGNQEEAKRALLRAAALEPEYAEIAEALQSSSFRRERLNQFRRPPPFTLRSAETWELPASRRARVPAPAEKDRILGGSITRGPASFISSGAR